LCIYHPVGGPYRGFGMSEIHFAIEQNLDIVAYKIGMDPAEFRKKNALKDGSSTVTGQILENVGLIQCLDKVTEDIEWARELLVCIKHLQCLIM